ncbi:lipopolysaccharide assembly protein LapB [Kordiimonas sp. SCSIO 12610]|uniref:tetratricopeptide repeat protein n=1 Tax=Kordiimonas sp. SCSIO 12610 TaxID=2829597 RepID=UPI00210EBEA2|nr:hypothetical protein [Kordiimonas sp. SCSIO 12610]UTW53925.1 hypothetical protein KFF44_08700 [Kordiimonas sp. SCSIO 12610]
MPNFNKILSVRIIFTVFILALTACSSGPERRTNNGAGPFSANARNEVARKSPEGLVRIGEGFERSGNLVNALNLYEQALANDPNLLTAKLAKGRILSQTSKRSEGISLLTTLVMEYPDLSVAKTTLAQAYAFGQEFEEAYAVIKPTAESGEATLPILALAGSLAQVLELDEKARVFYDKALQVDPKDSGTINNLAISFALSGEYESAIALLQPLLNNPRIKNIATKTLANIYALSGQLDAASVIIRSLVDPKEAKQQEGYFTLLDGISKREQAILLLFNVIPESVLKRINDASVKSSS